MRVLKWWQNFHFWLNCSFQSHRIPATNKQLNLQTLKQHDPIFQEVKNTTMSLWEQRRKWSMTFEVTSLIYLCVYREKCYSKMTCGTGCSFSVHRVAVQMNHCVCAWRHCCKAAHLHLNAAQELCAWKIIFQCDYLKPVVVIPLCTEIALYTIWIIYGRHLHYRAWLREEENAA